MAARTTRKTPRKTARKSSGRKTRARTASSAPGVSAAPKMADIFKMTDTAELAKYAKTLTPEQAFEMYRQNAKLALEVIEHALEDTGRVRKLQYESEERARSMQRKTARGAAEAGDVQSLMAVGQSAAQEAVEQSIAYWGQMFDLIVEIQKRLFALMESKAAGLPGAREAQAAMKMLPDLAKMQNVVSAMQGLMSTSTGAFEQMQKVMGDVARMSGLRR